MAEQNNRADLVDVGATAGVIDRAVFPAVEEEAKASITPPTRVDVNKVLSGEITSLGDTPIRPSLIAKAAQNDVEAISAINRQVIEYNRGVDKIASEPQFMFTKRDDTGKLVQDIPTTLSDKPAVTVPLLGGFGPSEKKQAEDIAESQINLQERLQELVSPDVQTLLADYYQTGFFQQVARDAENLAKGAFKLPKTGLVYGEYVVRAAADAIATNKSFGEAWQNYSSDAAAELADHRRFISNRLNFEPTYAAGLNEELKERYIAQYGREAYLERYEPLINEETGERLKIPLVSDEAADALLTFGFSQLPAEEQFAALFLPNAAVSTAFGKLHLARGAAQLKRVDERAKVNPEIKKMNPTDAIRVIRISDTKNSFALATRRFKANIGSYFSRTIGYRGPIGDAAENAEHARQLSKLNSDIGKYDNAIHTQQAMRASDDSIVIIPDDTPKGLKMTLKDAIIRRKNLQTRMDDLRRGTMYTGNPFMSELISDEVLVTAGQTAGYNILPSFFQGMDGDTGGMIGALTTAFGGRPTLSLVKGTGRFVGGFTTFGQPISNIGRYIEDIHLAPRSFFVDRTFDDVSAAIGRQLTPEEVVSFQQASKLMANLTPAARDKVFSSLQKYGEIRNRIVNAFPEGEPRIEALNAFTLSFGHASGLAPLQVLEKSNIKKLKTNLNGLQGAINAQLEAEDSLRIASLGMDNLRRMMKESGDMIDVADRDYIEMMVTGFEAAADGQLKLMNLRKTEYLKYLREYKNSVIEDPSSEISGDLLQQLVDVEVSLTPGALNDIEAQRTILVNSMVELDTALARRMEGVDMLRGTADHKLASGRMAELMASVRDQKIRMLGQAAYKNANDAIGNQSIDMQPLFDDLLNKLEVSGAGAISTFFSPQSEFLRSRTGKFAFEALNDAAERSLRGLVDNDQADFDQLILIARTPTKIVYDDPRLPDGKEVPNDDFISEDASFAEIAATLSARQSDDGERFIAFPATPFEAEEIKRHFNAKARSLSGDDASKSTAYSDAAEAVEASFAQFPQVQNAMKAARKEYQRVVFDPVQAEGTLGNKISSAMSSPEVAEPTPQGYQRRFASGEYPDSWHDPMATAAGKAISTGSNADVVAFNNQMNEFGKFWADSVTEVGGKKVFVYDMTIEGNSEENFSNIGGMLQNAIYNAWGDQVRTNTLDKLKLGSLGATSTAGSGPVGGNYDFSRIENIRQLEDGLTVYVKTASGELQPRQWFSMERLIAEENDIVRLVELDADVRKKYDKFVQFVNDETTDVAEAGKLEIARDKRVADKLNEASRLPDPAQFYEKYVVNYNEGQFETLRQKFIEGYSAAEKNVSPEEAEEVFKQGVAYMITNGLIARAKMQPSAEVTFKSFDGSVKQIETAANAAQMANDLKDPSTLKILRNVLSDDHIQYMQDMADMMLIASGTSLAGFTQKGIRGISPNEMISRAFNVARGMVSPTYVGAEFAFRILEEQKVSAFEIAASSEEGARIMQLLMKDPSLLTDADVRTFSTIVTSVTVRELLKRGERAPDYVPQEAVEAAYYNPKRDQNNENVQ